MANPKSQSRHPMQPFVRSADGVVRFKPNEIVRFLLDIGGIDMNRLAGLSFSQEDRTQFAQLIGYSLSGFHELSYVPDTVAIAASKAARRAGFANAEGCRDILCSVHCGVRDELEE